MENWEKAQLLLEDELIQDAFQLIEDNLIMEFKNVKPSKEEDLREIKYMFHALTELKRYIVAQAQAGILKE